MCFSLIPPVIRGDERKILEKGAYVQSMSSSVSPTVPILASVFMFLAYVLTGNDLTATLVYTLKLQANVLTIELMQNLK